MVLRYFFAFVVLMVCSCKSQKSGTIVNSQDNELKLVVEDAYFPVEEKQAMVIENEKDLQAFFSKVNRTRKPGLPLPTIDFNNEVAVVICAGPRKGNQMPYLEKITETDESINMVITNGSSDQEIGKEVTIYPFTVYKMPKPQGEVSFTWQ